MAAHKNVLVPNTLNVVKDFWHRFDLLFWKLFQRIYAPGDLTSGVVVVASVNCSVLALWNEVICLPIPTIAVIHSFWAWGGRVILCLVTEHLSIFWVERVVLPELRVLRVLVHWKVELLLCLSKGSRDTWTCKLRHCYVFELRFVHSNFTFWALIPPSWVDITNIYAWVSFWKWPFQYLTLLNWICYWTHKYFVDLGRFISILFLVLVFIHI